MVGIITIPGWYNIYKNNTFYNKKKSEGKRDHCTKLQNGIR